MSVKSIVKCNSLHWSTYHNHYAGQRLNSLIFHGNINCITVNGYTIIYFGANYVCHVMTIHFAGNFKLGACWPAAGVRLVS